MSAKPRSEYDTEVRKAMAWWRAANPAQSKSVKLISCGWHGHVLWTTYGDAGVLMTVADMIKQYRSATGAAT